MDCVLKEALVSECIRFPRSLVLCLRGRVFWRPRRPAGLAASGIRRGAGRRDRVCIQSTLWHEGNGSEAAEFTQIATLTPAIRLPVSPLFPVLYRCRDTESPAFNEEEGVWLGIVSKEPFNISGELPSVFRAPLPKG